MIRVLLSACWLAVGLSGLSCMTVEAGYEGAAPPREALGRVDVRNGKLTRIDGREVFADAVDFLPGLHEVVAEFRVRGGDFGPRVRDDYVGKLVCLLTFRTAAGAEYEVGMNSPKGGDRRGSRTRYYHSAYVKQVPGDYLRSDAPCRWKS